MINHILPAFQGRSCTPQNGNSIRFFGTHNCHISTIITRSIFLFVGILMLFINDDYTNIFERSKDRTSGSDHDFAFPVFDFFPLFPSFAIIQVAVQNCYFSTKSIIKSFYHLWCKRDLRNQHQGCFIIFQTVTDNLDINFCFPASRNSIKQESPELIFVQILNNFFSSFFLFVCQNNFWRDSFLFDQISFII